MSIILHDESASSKMKELLIKELIQGKEYANQLKFMLNNHVESDGSVSVKELVTNVLRTFSETISVMNSSEACNFDEVAQNHLVNNNNNSGEDGSLVAASCNDDVKSEDSNESKKRLLPTTTKDRRGSYKRRYYFFFFFL
jgi:hypothetical protein